ncbi:MAG: pseudouridine synthase [Rhizobiaceae bacterium]
MDDDNNKSGKPKGPRGPRPAGARTGKPADGGKPRGKSFGGKPGGKSFGGKSAAPDGKRPFARDAASVGQDGAKPFRKGPRPERAGGDDRRSLEGRAAFSKDRSFSGEKRPYREKGASAGDRPPRPASGDRPFRKDARPEQGAEGGRKPYRDTGDRPAGNGPRPAWKKDGDRKPFEKPQYHGRPGRAEREQARDGGGDGARSFGSKRHVEARTDGGERPRSYGQRTQDSTKRGDQRPRERRPEAVVESGERIAKRLARAGIASRREAEDLVSSGRVKVNGHVLASPAFNVEASDRIEVDGTEIPPIERTRLFLFHKPAGVVTTNRDPEGRRTVFDVLPKDLPRLMTVGRLDINTEGLLLLTNDGGLSRVLELPSTGWLRRYRVRVHGEVDQGALAGLKDGIAVDGVFYGAIEAALERVQGTNAWLTIGLREGKNREVKNIMGALGLEVNRLIRISFGPFQLGELPEGQVQELKGRLLRDQLGDRLIEEAGANFDAPIINPFSSKPAQEEEPVRKVRAPAPLAVEPGEGGLIKRRKRRPGDVRDDALGRLSTRPERGRPSGRGDKDGFKDKPFAGGRGKDGDRKPAPPAEPRKANVWMAPGARPQGKGADAKGKGGGSGAGKPRSPSSRGGDGGRPRGPRKG